ncbi:DegT/DnrJ/EryC1/StrS family aminotransferase [Cognataquiflexum rubidum]|uniref:DegT/DnrJ/EryC1/StrS family aminotransferase n=1 Tax=Cognataquiflexum rubidum TaxID=2922273 RepID=UPI001F1449C8|nr:DegT/DnrJ/EryC1/StrS family aminotransferase [Cognataquiflexum rubidum]MCH6236635.1 DegT/DnrJ/EryC1/StrS family aminotransferase [Cognataquiflexum rubidum]
MLKPIPLSTPVFDGYENDFVLQAIGTKQISTAGNFITDFEDKIKNRLGNFNVALKNSGTSAIHLALRLIGIGTGDEVLCQSFTFCASANPIIYLGGTPIFIDSEPNTWNMCPEILEDAILDRIKKGKKPKAIIVVDLFGMPARFEEILKISQKYEIPVIEDAAEALGSSVDGRECGTFGEFGVISFNGNKIITTGSGGALISANFEAIENSKYLAVQAREVYKYYVHKEIGYNYRMNNMSAGIGLAQFLNLDKKIALRRKVFGNYQNLLSGFEGFSTILEPDGYFSNRWLSTFLVNQSETGFSNEDVRLTLLKENIESRYLWNPLHLQPVFKDTTFYGGGVSEDLFSKGICLPSSENLSIDDQERIIGVIKRMYT